MRLLDTETIEFREVYGTNEVQYAILSHRWEQDEILYKDLADPKLRAVAQGKAGWVKLNAFCRKASEYGFKYAWMDNCCIDKSSSAELQESINSMYNWYMGAETCFAYLSDICDCLSTKEHQLTFSDHSLCIDDFINSQWFKRGWTLQELLAPKSVVFLNRSWAHIGGRESLRPLIHTATNIPQRYLDMWSELQDSRPCFAEVMSWARDRKTTRIEDRAYSMLGLFDVNLPMLYGEGQKAFVRLQEEVLKTSDDQSVFAWEDVEVGRPGLLAASPDFFPVRPSHQRYNTIDRFHGRRNMAISNQGISTEMHLVYLGRRTVAAVTNISLDEYMPLKEHIPLDNLTSPQARLTSDQARNGAESNAFKSSQQLGIFLRRLDSENRWARIPGNLALPNFYQDLSFLEVALYERIKDHRLDFMRLTLPGIVNMGTTQWRSPELQTITVVRTIRSEERTAYTTRERNAFQFTYVSPTFMCDPATTDSSTCTCGPNGQDHAFPSSPSPTFSLSEPQKLAGYITLHRRLNLQDGTWSTDGTSAIAFGFDRRFTPILILNVLGRGFTSDSPERFSRLIEIDSGFASGQCDLKSVGSSIVVLGNCEVRLTSVGMMISLRPALINCDNGSGLIAKLMLPGVRGDRKPLLRIAMARESADVPWQVNVQ